MQYFTIHLFFIFNGFSYKIVSLISDDETIHNFMTVLWKFTKLKKKLYKTKRFF